MAKIVVGPFDKGLKTGFTPFNVDNTNLTTLFNAFVWRGRIKRKRGTSFLTRLNYYLTFTVTLVADSATLPQFPIKLGSISLVGSVDGTTYTDPLMNGTLTATGGTGTGGTINYATGVITIIGGGTETLTGSMYYYPALPVMGEEDLMLQPTQFPGTIAFDTKYAYNLVTASPYPNYNINFYKNPAPDSVNLPGYVPKTTATSFNWNGQNYQQFWSTNYENALWVTNGITIPFSATNSGMQSKPIVSTTVTSGGPPAIISLNIVGHGLVVGDFLFINEVAGTIGINFQTGYVITVTDANNVVVEFPFATITTNGTGGIAQYLTNTSTPTKDCLKWYDGDPTNGVVMGPTPMQGHGWVNFCPPLSQGAYSIGNLPENIYYLVNSRMIVPFKDRILFLGPVIGTSGGSLFYLQDTVIYSQNGTPYYNCSFTGSPTSPTNQPVTMLAPDNQSAFPAAYFEDDTGFGGFTSAGIPQPITTVSTNEDVLIVGFSFTKTRLTYTGNDLVPFNFFIINAELGDSSTFSVINMDKGVISRGSRGYIISSQVESQRIDLDIPDQVFQIDLTDNGNERFCSIRDFINEWIFFTYNSNSVNNATNVFPDQTLFYNYRDNSWAIFNESYTSYGSFRRQTGFTWQTVGLIYKTWAEWNEPWNAGESSLLQQEVIAGNQQGFIVVRDEGTSESDSLYISAFDGTTNTVTSPNHNMLNQQWIVVDGMLGTSSVLNGVIYQIGSVTTNTFVLLTIAPIGSVTYLGGGLIKLAYVPFIQTRQFPMAWDMGRKTRIGVQQYLLTTTANSQITLQIYLSQNANFNYSVPPVPVSTNSNDAVIYSQILYTCPESTNLGLTPTNINLNTPTAAQQAQIWHRINTSLIGDTVQLGFTLSDAQMMDQVANNAYAEIELHGIIIEATASQMLC